jgi:hypothetical protein
MANGQVVPSSVQAGPQKQAAITTGPVPSGSTMMHPMQARIAAQPNHTNQAMGDYHPWGTASTPVENPVHAITYHPDQRYPWGAVAYEDAPVVWDTDGAPVPASSGGSWGNVVAAGRASPAHS